MEGCRQCFGRGHGEGEAEELGLLPRTKARDTAAEAVRETAATGRLSQEVGPGYDGESSLLDVVAAGRKKPVRAIGKEALVIAAGEEALTVVVGKALCGKG